MKNSERIHGLFQSTDAVFFSLLLCRHLKEHKITKSHLESTQKWNELQKIQTLQLTKTTKTMFK